MMPPTSIDGTDITGATIDGTDVTEITVDGQTVFTPPPSVPASMELLDDWEDGNLTSSRDDFDTTPFGGTTSTLVESGAVGSLARPDWVMDEGSPSVVGSEHFVSDRDGCRTSFSPANLDGFIWEFRYSGTGNGYINITANSTTRRISGSSDVNLEDGYFLFIGSSVALARDSGGSTSTVISGPSTPSGEFNVKVTRDASGTFELFIDGTSEGTGTDTTFTSSNHVGFANVNGQSEIYWYAIDDGS